MALSGRQGRTYTFPFQLVLSDGPTDGWINRWTDLIELRVRIEKKDQVTEQTADLLLKAAGRVVVEKSSLEY